jgi:type II secretory pathway component PulF
VAVGRLDAELLRLRRALLGPLIRPFLSVLAACFLLPIPTAVLGSASAYLIEVGLSLGVVSAVVLAVLGALRAIAESPRWSQRLLGAPFGRDVDRWLIATVLEATTRAGTPPGRVFARLREASVEVGRRARFDAARALLEQGGGFTEAIALLGLFDATARLEIRAGEESGTLEEVFRGVARDAGEQMVSRLRLASTILTFVVSLLVLGALALRILAGFKAALGGTDDVLRQLEAETPIRLLEGLKEP